MGCWGEKVKSSLTIMATYKYIEVHLKEARYLADLNGIKIDLEAAIDLCNFLLDTYRMEKPDVKFTEPLSIAILIKYSRSFVTGVRKRLSINSVSGLNHDELEQHNKFIALRNKHIAHSVNKFEENTVKAYYNDEKVFTEGITSISIGHARLTGLSGYDAETIIALSKKIIDYVNSEMENEKTKIFKIVRNIPIDDLLRSTPGSFYPKTLVSGTKIE
jgi:hypothetical protein